MGVQLRVMNIDVEAVLLFLSSWRHCPEASASICILPSVVGPSMLELLFVGAGPHSLATLTRLLEPNPDPGVDAPQRHVVPKEKVRASAGPSCRVLLWQPQPALCYHQ